MYLVLISHSIIPSVITVDEQTMLTTNFAYSTIVSVPDRELPGTAVGPLHFSVCPSKPNMLV